MRGSCALTDFACVDVRPLGGSRLCSGDRHVVSGVPSSCRTKCIGCRVPIRLQQILRSFSRGRERRQFCRVINRVCSLVTYVGESNRSGRLKCADTNALAEGE